VSERHKSDLEFTGSVPELYDLYLVPLIFDAYAADLVNRLGDLKVGSILEVAAGSGVVTRAMATGLPASVSITATDLNQPMIDYARSVGTSRPVVWQSGDAMDLPFDGASFEAVVCQFGVMFFPDRPAAFAEVARVLRPGGVFLFNVWDAIEHNEFASVVSTAVADMFPDDPPLFLERTPYSYFDEATIQTDVASGGFVAPASIEVFETRSRAQTAGVPAIAFCQGTPLRNEIEARLPSVFQRRPRWLRPLSKSALAKPMSTARFRASSLPLSSPLRRKDSRSATQMVVALTTDCGRNEDRWWQSAALPSGVRGVSLPARYRHFTDVRPFGYTSRIPCDCAPHVRVPSRDGRSSS